MQTHEIPESTDQQQGEHLPPKEATISDQTAPCTLVNTRWKDWVRKRVSLQEIIKLEKNNMQFMHTTPSDEKCFSISLFDTRDESPVTYKLFPGFSASLES